MAKRVRFRFANCGHLGRGAYCHRCREAERMEEFAEIVKKGGKLKKPKREGPWLFEKWNHFDFEQEAKRLRAPAGEYWPTSPIVYRPVEEPIPTPKS